MKKVLVLAIFALLARLHAQEAFYFGATTNVAGGQLVFENAAGYVADGGYCFGTSPGTAVDFSAAGYFSQDQLNDGAVFSALPASDPNGAAPGTTIQVQLLSVEGPTGATVGFWESDGGGNAGSSLTWSVPVPSFGNTNLIRVTEAADSATNDPYGNVLGRALTFSQPGLYKLTWQLVDTSTNGPDGGPQDSPSEPFAIYYQADITIAGIAPAADGIQITFAAVNPNVDYYVEESDSLGADAFWTTSEPVHYGDKNAFPGDGQVHTYTYPLPQNGPTKFFRIRTQSIGGS